MVNISKSECGAGSTETGNVIIASGRVLEYLLGNSAFTVISRFALVDNSLYAAEFIGIEPNPSVSKMGYFISRAKGIKEGNYTYHRVFGVGKITNVNGKKCFVTIKLSSTDGSITTPSGNVFSI